MVQRCSKMSSVPADLSGGATRCQGPHDCFYFEPSAAKGRDFLWKLWKTRFIKISLWSTEGKYQPITTELKFDPFLGEMGSFLPGSGR